MPNRPVLTLAEIDAFDPTGPPGRKWCPLCGDGKPKDAAHRSLSIDRATGLWKCFRCNESGQVKESWAPLKPKSDFEKRASLRAAFGERPPRTTQVLSPSPVQLVPQIPVVEEKPANDWLELWEGALALEGTPGATYLEGRGIPSAIAALAGVRFCLDWHNQRVVLFPIHNREGILVAAQGRSIQGNAKITRGPKKEGAFFAPVQMGSGRVCAPFDRAVPAIVLTEAPIDALSVAACGFPALALCGTSGPSWLHLACGLREVVLAFDADEAGDKAALEMADRLESYGAKCTRLRPEGAKDWNEALLKSRGELVDWLAGRLLV